MAFQTIPHPRHLRFHAPIFWGAVFLLFAAGLATAAPGKEAKDAAEPIRVACIGDSITQGSGAEPGKSYPSQLQELLGEGWKVGNFGVSGRTLLRNGDFPYWKETALRDSIDFHPHVVVIMLGTNDTKPQNWKFRDEFLNDYRDLVKGFRSLPSQPRIFVCRPCPVPEPGNFGINEAGVQEQIPLIDQLAREQGLGLIDMHAALAPHPETLPDRVHPNTAGAAIMARTVAAAIKPNVLLPAGLKLMPLGDSVTFGYNGTNAGYRGFLYNLLAPIAPGLQFVGSSVQGNVTTTDSPLPKDQRNNEGHGSFTIKDISDNLDGLNSTMFDTYGGADRDPNGGRWLTGTGTRAAVHPDIITLMIGTNDNGPGPSSPEYDRTAVQKRLHDLLTKLTTLRPHSKVFIAKIIPRGEPSNAEDYNTIVASEAAAFKAAGKQVFLVDLHTGFPISSGLTSDGVHPNDTGFAWMAERWFDAIVAAYSNTQGASVSRH